MINTLHIENIGIIDDLSIDLGEGFNVLTGETGAGKTLIIDSLQILAGGRFSKDMIRTGEPSSFVELSLYLPGKGLEDDMAIISRETNLSGKNICKLNGRLATVSELRNFMKNVIDIHGQHDNQEILEKESHIEYLDKFAGKKLIELKDKYQELYEKRNKIQQELKSNYGDEKERERVVDLLKYQVNEIEAVKLKKNEEEELNQKRQLILNAEQIMENLKTADYNVNEVAIEAVNTAVRALEKISALNSDYQKIAESLQTAYYDLEECGRDIAGINNELGFDEEERIQIEERLDLIFSLKRKYGNSIEEILQYNEKIKKELYEIEHLEEYRNQLKKEIQQIENQMKELAQKMHEIREKTAIVLNQKITEELKDLEMKNAKFKANLELKDEFNPNGLDKIEFLISTNVGDIYKPLIKIASGGEMSRIMLGIKKVLAEVDNVPVLVFDEIDTGISGVAANKVAEKLKAISATHQVLCITHQASIAAKGDNNFYICKEIENAQTKTKVRKLDKSEKIKEIARIATGEINEISLKHAESLIG